MSDNRKDNGGARKGAGRPAKADEQQLIEKLTPLQAEGHKALKNGLKEGHSWAVKLFFEYMYGKPKQQIEQTNLNYNQDLTDEDVKMLNKELEDEY